jgi:hypothetical protein
MAIHDIKQLVVALRSMHRDRENRAVFGAAAPRTAELIWVDPKEINHYLGDLPEGLNIRRTSGRIVDFERRGLHLSPLEDVIQVKSSLMHWRDGLPWEKTPDFIHRMTRVKLLRAGIRRNTKSAIVRRYRALDEIYSRIGQDQAFKTQKQLKRWNFREFGGVQICIDGAGRLGIMRGSGLHRITIAKLLDLPYIPAMVGLVDVGAVSYLELLRLPPEQRTKGDRSAPNMIGDYRLAEETSSTPLLRPSLQGSAS